MKTNIIYNEDCGQGMKRLPDNSIDLIATDPPYGIKFMGKSWDKALPDIEVWQECLRVLKPGAFAFVMCIPRQDCLARMIVRLEDAGFNVSFTSMFHCFAQGFPKSQNIGKAVDKRLGVERKVIGQKVRGDVEKAKRNGTTFAAADANKNNKAIFGYGIEDLTLPATPQAQALNGSYGGFQPKPAVEVVIIAMKPLSEKTYVDQALKNRHGITWLDEGRIPGNKPECKNIPRKSWREMEGRTDIPESTPQVYNKNEGRFPANLLVSDDVLNDGKVRKSPASYIRNVDAGGGILGKPKPPGMIMPGQGDSGSFSRYFSLDSWWEKRLKDLPESVRRTFPFLIVPKASKAEKNRGCEGLPDEHYKERKDPSKMVWCKKCNHHIQPTRKVKGNCCCEIPELFYKEIKFKPSANQHPCVKPIKLMSYLITLGSRECDIILDPFIGSGTTAIAAVMTDRHYIGYETDKEYVKIANSRLSEIQLELIK